MYRPSVGVDFNCYNENDCKNGSVIFPKPPVHLIPSVESLPCCRSESIGSGFSDVDSYSEDEQITLCRKKTLDISKLLPPIGVFWDIENCHVPKGKSATAVAQAIRDKFFVGYREADFIVVCDVTKEKNRIIQELNDAQVNLIHVAATCKNAADEKLRQTIRRFADTHSAPAAIILISGDVNFAGDLNDLKNRKKIHVILVHHSNVSKALVLCASEHHSFSDLVEKIPTRELEQSDNTLCEIIVSNLPKEKEPIKVKSRLKQLCENSGGKVGFISKTMCSIRFPSIEFAIRARKRMDGEDVFGNKIIMSEPLQIEDWNYHVRRSKKMNPKEDSDSGRSIIRRVKENNFQFNELHSNKTMGNGEMNNSLAQNIDLSFQNQLTKNTAPFFPNNMTSFTFQKVPNIENLKIVQNSSKSYNNNNSSSNDNNNNLDGESDWRVMDGDHGKKVSLESKKFDNVLTNQIEGFRLNNTVSVSENNQLFLAQTQQLQMFAENAFPQKNLGSSCNEVGRINGSGGFHRGIHGSKSFNFNASSRVSSDESGESLISDKYFEPIQKPIPECSSPVDLHVSGLDPHIDLMMVKNLLTNSFKMHVEVLSVSVFCLSDGSLVARVKVPSFQDAQYAISQLQRRRLGSKKITIAFQNNSRYQRQLMRSQVAQLLSEMPQDKTPLFRFTELFKSRFLNSVSVSELNKMKDICIITEEESGRMISGNFSNEIDSFSRQEKKEAAAPYCELHSHKALSDSELPVLPTVNISLKLLTNRIRTLLESHGDKLFLPSLADCYEAEFGPLPEDAGGVPLEHLVSCLPGIELSQSHGSFKYLTWSQAVSHSNDDHAKRVSPMLVGTMSVFTRELLDLLKDTPKCLLPFSQFIPSYHRKYGRQCRVSDYGYTKLLDLLESLPRILQVMGNGTYKVVTLSHKAQMRRFTTDLLRILKNQTNRQLDLKEFGAQYEKIIGKPWDPCQYGLCELEDLISCTPQSAIVMETKEDGKTMISIPKREQTPEEIDLTKRFSHEVIELLKRVPNCSIEFNKFVPAYHNQFGRQCRVSSYGCFKLIELFESIPETVSIQEDISRGEKYLVLTPAKKIQVFAERICEILSSEGGVMLLFRLERAYQFYQYDSIVSPSDCECKSFEDVLNKIPEYVKLEDTQSGRLVVLLHNTDPALLIRRVRFVLFHHEKLPANQFTKAFSQQYQIKLDLDADLGKIPEVVKIVRKGGETFVQLTHISVFANQMYALLCDHNGRIPLVNFESAYLNKYKKPCSPSQFNHPNLSSLLSAIPETVNVQYNGYYTQKRIITLNSDLQNAGFRVPMLNNGSSNLTETNARSRAEKMGRSYDLWQGDSLFQCWNDRFVPENITTPHPSELPLPSAKLASPIQKMLLESDSGSRGEIRLHEVEATSTTDENSSGNVETENRKSIGAEENKRKRMNRIAAQFDNFN